MIECVKIMGDFTLSYYDEINADKWMVFVKLNSICK